MSYRDRLDPALLKRWDVIATAAASALPGAGLPPSITADALARTILQVAEAKGLAILPAPGRMNVTPLGWSLRTLLYEIGNLKLERWGEAARAVNAEEGHPDPAGYLAATRHASEAPQSHAEARFDLDAAGRAWDILREAELAIRRGECVRARLAGPDGVFQGLAWVPSDVPPALLSQLPAPSDLQKLRSSGGHELVTVERRALGAALLAAAVRYGLVHVGHLGDARTPIPAAGEERVVEVIWALYGAGDAPPLTDIVALLMRLSAEKLAPLPC